MRRPLLSAGTLAFLILTPDLAEATNGVELHDVGNVLLVFLVLSLVFEVALTPIFNSRFFIRHLEGRGVKIPITIGVAFLVFWSYDLDIIQELLNALGRKTAAGSPMSLSFGGQVLTALLIAGGSDGVFRIFSKLGIRNPAERKEKAALEREIIAEKAETEKIESQAIKEEKRALAKQAEQERAAAEIELEQARSSSDNEAVKRANEKLEAKREAESKALHEKAIAEKTAAKKEQLAAKARAERIGAEKAAAQV